MYNDKLAEREKELTVEEYQEKVCELRNTDIINLHISPDFQTDKTLGFPTSLCVNWEKRKAWLELNQHIIKDGENVDKYLQACADYSFKDCSDEDRFNSLLKCLGEDAYDTAKIYPEDMDEQTL